MKVKTKIISFIMLCAILIGIYPSLNIIKVVSGYTSQTYPFGFDENTTFTVVSEAPLSWDETEKVNFTITVNATAVPLGDNITIVLITIVYNYPDDPDPHPYTWEGPDYNLTGVGENYNLVKELQAPSDVNKFNITIVMIVRSTTHSNQEFNAFFPGDSENPYIDIKTSVVIPIINLPGFPDIQTFSRWILIFGIIFVIIAMPSVFVGTMKTKETIQNRKKKKGGGEK